LRRARDAFEEVRVVRYLRGLREARERALLTQEAVSAASGVTVSTISRLENGLQAARLDTIGKLAAVVKVPAEELIDWERPAPRIGAPTKGKAAA
jgi:transcriptional regulator with XRE-family HTH domain